MKCAQVGSALGGHVLAAEPKSIRETGLSSSYIEALICKHLATTGTSSGRATAETIGLPFSILGELFDSLRTRQIVVHSARPCSTTMTIA